MLLPMYKSLDEKNRFFKPSKHYKENKIDDIKGFDRWYKDFSRPYKHPTAKFDFFFRGMKDARYKLFNSLQREWLANTISAWGCGDNYLDFIKSLIEDAKSQRIFEKVLAYHQIGYDSEADFPILSILQHYGAPTPLMDWSYSLDVALYFATEEVSTASASEDLGGYFSIYIILKKGQNGGLKNIFEYTNKQFPNLGHFRDAKFIADSKSNFVCYISDFENNDQVTWKPRPLTTYYNHNIIPQEGFFIFNPYPDKPLEECFNTKSRSEATEKIDNQLNLAPFLCYNIRKDLADYIRRKIRFGGIDSAYIYPQLRSFAAKVKEDALNKAVLKPQPNATPATPAEPPPAAPPAARPPVAAKKKTAKSAAPKKKRA